MMGKTGMWISPQSLVCQHWKGPHHFSWWHHTYLVQVGPQLVRVWELFILVFYFEWPQEGSLQPSVNHNWRLQSQWSWWWSNHTSYHTGDNGEGVGQGTKVLFTLGFKMRLWAIGSQVDSRDAWPSTLVSIMHLQGVQLTTCVQTQLLPLFCSCILPCWGCIRTH